MANSAYASQSEKTGVIGNWKSGKFKFRTDNSSRCGRHFRTATLNNTLGAANTTLVSNIIMRLLSLTATAFLVLSILCIWLVRSRRVSYFVLNRNAVITVNGTRVPGRVLDGKSTVIVTTEMAGKEHSYELRFEEDTDFTGNMGNVVDCHEWSAPRLRVLIETRDYPPCMRQEHSESKGWPLINSANGMEFITADGQTVGLMLRSDASRLH